MHPAYFPVFFWSLLIFLAVALPGLNIRVLPNPRSAIARVFWSYGELLRRRINRPEFADIGWGLTCAWGMSVVLALGGVLMAFRLAKAPNLTLLVLFGTAAAVYYLAGLITTKDTKKRNPGNPKSNRQN